MNRRGFIFGLGSSLIAAPAIVRAASLMPVRGIIMPIYGASPGAVVLEEARKLDEMRVAWMASWEEAARIILPAPPQKLTIGHMLAAKRQMRERWPA